jgi:tetratricopeptide (TPR) repeat protein
MNKLFYLSVLIVPSLLHTTNKLIALNSATQGYSVHPQQGNTGNLLDIVAGDTRTLIGNSMLEKAEAYYHGGISDHGDCSAITGGKHNDHDTKKQSSYTRFDPWKYLYDGIHAEAHIHLALNKAEELLPWYWVACEASPHNIQAFEATAYALATMLQQPQEALRLLEKGITSNPNNVKLEITRGEIFIKHLKNFTAAEVAFRAAYEKSVREKAPRDDMLKAEALFYLGYLAKRCNDLDVLHRWQAIAKETMSPDLASIRDLLKIE